MADKNPTIQSKGYDFGTTPVHAGVASLVRPGSRVLDIGCATGQLSRLLTEQLECMVTGVELFPDQAVKAQPYCEKVIIGDICDKKLWDSVEGPFDHIVMADVIEHLVKPGVILQQLRKWLRQDGSVILSVPNVAHCSIRWKLLSGKWNYESYGILDDTHVRFYTRSTVLELLSQNGYDVRSIRPSFRIPGDAFARRHGFLSVKRATFDMPMMRLFPCLFAYQFILECIPHCP